MANSCLRSPLGFVLFLHVSCYGHVSLSGSVLSRIIVCSPWHVTSSTTRAGSLTAVRLSDRLWVFVPYLMAGKYTNWRLLSFECDLHVIVKKTVDSRPSSCHPFSDHVCFFVGCCCEDLRGAELSTVPRLPLGVYACLCVSNFSRDFLPLATVPLT